MTTHVLTLTDGTTSVLLGSGAHALREYVPVSPELSTVDFSPVALRDGGERVVTTRRNVTESAKVSFKASTTDGIRTAVRTVENLFRLAEEYQYRRAGSPVYVQFDPGNSGTVYRSELLSGRVTLGDQALFTMRWSGLSIEALLTWTRRYYWEANAETEIPLDNGDGTGKATGGKTVYNLVSADFNGSFRSNYVHIVAADVTGVIPTPVRLTIENTTNSALRLYTVYIGHNVFATPASFSAILEAEDSTAVVGTTLPRSDSSGVGFVIENCESAWNESTAAGVTSTADAADKQVGTASAKLAIGAAVANGTVLATKVITSLNMSNASSVRVWIKSQNATSLGDLQLLMDDTAACVSPVYTLNIPALVANTWTEVTLSLPGHPTAGETALISIGLKLAAGAGVSNVVHIDQVRADGGQDKTFTLTGSFATLLTWILDATYSQNAAGQYFRVIGKFRNTLPVSFTLQLRLELGTGDIIWQGPDVTITTANELRDLGLIQIPPYRLPTGTHSNIVLRMLGKKTGGGTLIVDFIQLTPTDSYRVLDPRAYGMDYQRTLILDEIGDQIYQQANTGATSMNNLHTVRGSPIMLWPGLAQRLYFFHTNNSGNSLVTDTTKVSAFYRPRRLTF